LKFKLNDDYLVAATLRPETIYGQTNLWINPEAIYVRVEVDGDNWIMSREAADKLKYQKDDVILKEDVNILDFIGKKALAPGIEKEIIILPAKFANPNVGSGIVTCVPSDAPYDYIALKTLQEDEKLCKKFKLDYQEIQNINLIPIIKTKGYGDYPAKEITTKKKITELDDPKLEEATKEIYKAGFHTGIMTKNCASYGGKTVEEAKELIKAKLLEENKADIFYDLSEEVICRCGSKVVIKRIDDQWFIRYSDQELTERSKEQTKEMTFMPKEYQDNMLSVLDWFNDRACARLGNWLGSKFPFDEKWTVEPISDSTLYPIYYIVSKYINNKTIKVNELTEEFFDYVFLGKKIEKDKINQKWEPIKEEFEYFYPLDLNLGGKEHKTVHFPVFLMNHVAILPEAKWPRGIFVNWWITGKGSKISKSKGGAEPVPNAMKKYGVDAMRLYYAHIGNPHVDVVWTEETVFNYKNALEKIYHIIEEIKKLNGKSKIIDQWLISKINEHLKQINSSMEEYNLRELASTVYYSIYDDLRWYLRRGGENKKTIEHVISIWLKIMNPLTPHLSEELNNNNNNNNNNNKQLISSSSWPEIDTESISLKAEAGEEIVKTAMDGMRNVLKLAKLEKANKFTLFIAEAWLYDLFRILSSEMKVTRNVGEVMKKVLEEEKMKIKGKEVSKIVLSVMKDASKLPTLVTSMEEELITMQEAKEFLEKEFNCSIEIILAKDTEDQKAKSAMPGKVGILVE